MATAAWMLASAMFLLAGRSARATEVVPVGPEFRISRDGDTYNYQGDSYARDQAIVRKANGDFLVIWEGYTENTNEESSAIHARTLDAQGHPLGGEFPLVPIPGSPRWIWTNYTRPSLAADPNGGVILAWGEDEVWVQRFDDDGQPRGARVQVNQTPADVNTQARNEIAADPQGGFLVVWENLSNNVMGRRYDPGDTPQGPEFQVNTVASGARAYPSIAADGLGRFVVEWESVEGISGQRLDSTGAALGGAFQISPFGSSELPTKIAAGPLGTFMGINSYYNRAHVYDANGVPFGPEFDLDPENGWGYTGVTTDDEGNFVVAWKSDYNTFAGRRYDPTGQPLGAVFQINESTSAYENRVAFNHPALATDAAGDFVVVWATYDYSTTQSRYIYGIFGRRFSVCGDGRRGPLACDDGDSSALDGCSAHCAVETCHTCSGEPSTCAQIPGCTAVCSDAATVDDKAILTIKKILPPAGDETITLRGAIVKPPVAAGTYDPSVDGAEVVITGGDLIYARATPTAIPPDCSAVAVARSTAGRSAAGRRTSPTRTRT